MDISPVKIVALAKIVHEANKAYCECIGDNSQLPWEETSGAIKNATIEGVERIIDNPNITSEEIHDSWVENKKRDG